MRKTISTVFSKHGAKTRNEQREIDLVTASVWAGMVRDMR